MKMNVTHRLNNDFMIEQDKKNVIITIRAKTEQPKFKTIFDDNKLVVCLKTKAEKNKANTELLKMFRKVFKKPVFLVSGEKSKTKKLVVENTETSEVKDALKKYQD